MKTYYLFFLLFFSCSIIRVIDHNEANKNLKNSRRQLIDLQLKILKDVSEKKIFLAEVKRYFDLIEYKKLISHLKEIIILENQNLNNIDSGLKINSSIPSLDKNLRSDEKEFNLYSQKRDVFKNILNTIDDTNKKIQLINSKIQRIVSDKKIFKINPIELKSKIDENKAKTIKQIDQVESQLRFFQQKYGKNKDLAIKLSNINKVLDKIKNKRVELFDYLERLNQIVIDQKHYWVAPGFFGHNYSNDIEKLLTDLKVLVSEYNLKVSQFN